MESQPQPSFTFRQRSELEQEGLGLTKTWLMRFAVQPKVALGWTVGLPWLWPGSSVAVDVGVIVAEGEQLGVEVLLASWTITGVLVFVDVGLALGVELWVVVSVRVGVIVTEGEAVEL
jgi:hypothetical protein